MTDEGRGPLDQVAGAVADGTPVDWVQEREATPPQLHEALEHLSVIERIKEIHSSPVPETSFPRESNIRSTVTMFTWGHLQIFERLGAGSWGDVYRAFDPTLRREVALKLLTFDQSPDMAAERFLSEARLLARVRHPNVLTVYGADCHEGRYGIWTELIRGQTLLSYVEGQGVLGAREAALIGLDLCRALSAVHGAGLVHRDVKAGNVMREEGGRIVLMDFGSGSDLLLDAHKGGARHIYGTPLVMAPEQLRGEAMAVSDVYGVGALLYWLVSRRYPTDATTYSEIAEWHRRGRYVSLRDRRADLPLGFVQVVERAIAPDPKDRVSSAGAFERALASIIPHPTWKEWVSMSLGAVRGWHWIAAAILAVIVVLIVRPIPPKPIPHPLPQPAPARAVLSATASLVRLSGGRSEAIAPGARIAPGDRLSMLLRGRDSMFVYVLNEDQAGNVYVLFPIPGLEPRNPLEGSEEHRLPGRLGESPVYWRVTSTGGKESIITVASREPLPEWERLIRQFPVARRDRPVVPNRVSQEGLKTLRGLGGLVVEPPQGDAARLSLADAIRSMKKKSIETGDVWIWTTELENPRP